MENVITQMLPNLGIAGFSIFIMWKMAESSRRQVRQKDEDFIKLSNEIHRMMLNQINDNTQALRDNTEALRMLKSNLTIK